MNKEEILTLYYEHNGARLHREVHKILKKFKWITDYDQYYSIANEVFVSVYHQYDGERDFNGLLYSCLFNKICSEITRINRDKRTPYVKDSNGNFLYKKDDNGNSQKVRIKIVSLDKPMDSESAGTLQDTLTEKNQIYYDAHSEDYVYKNKTLRYMNGLSNKQRKMIDMLFKGHTFAGIQAELRMTPGEMSECIKVLQSPEKLEILR